MSNNANVAGRSFSISPAFIRTFLTTLEWVCFTAGPALVAFNLFNFNIAKNGLYYKDAAQWGIAIGVFMITLSLALRRK